MAAVRCLLAIFLAVFPVAPHAPYPQEPAHPGPAWFINVAPQAGLTAVNVNGSANAKHFIWESTGSGVAILDYDGDGWPDIFLVNGTAAPDAGAPQHATSHLYRNNHDGTFTDVTAKAGLADTGWGQGACVGDFDNDGHPDLFVTGLGHNRLYHNNGDGTFTDIAEKAGVAGDGKHWGTGCAFVDYDRDGKLDIAVADYVHVDMAHTPKPGEGPGCLWKNVAVMCGPRGLEPETNILFHNLGNGKFADVSKQSGFEKTSGHYCFSVSTLDYNDDGWPDIYVACDSTPSILYRNNKDGTFTDVAPDAGVAFNEDGREQAGMGVAVGDYDHSGRQSLFKTNFSDDTPTLMHADSTTGFTDVTFPAGVGKNTDVLGWGAVFADIDNDGWIDLVVANGHVYPEVDSAQLGSTFREPRLLYHNLRNGKFEDITKTSGPGITTPASARGIAAADLFNDGRVDFVVNDLSDVPMLLVNVAPNTNHWLGLSLAGTKSNRSAIGARVTVKAGALVQIQEIRSGSSYNSSSDLRLHFGLGAEKGPAEITVRWPGGLTETFTQSGLDKIVSLEEGSGKAVPPQISAK